MHRVLIMGYAFTLTFPKGTPVSSIDISKYIDKLNEMSLKDEKWLPIKDKINFEGLYEVSNKGRVRSLPRVQEDKLGRIAVQTGCILKDLPSKQSSMGTYRQVILHKNNKQFTRLVHRLVAASFIPNESCLPFVNHIDGDPSNNCVENLEWCTAKQNTLHAIKLGLFKPGQYRIKKEVL